MSRLGGLSCSGPSSDESLQFRHLWLARSQWIQAGFAPRGLPSSSGLAWAYFHGRDKALRKMVWSITFLRLLIASHLLLSQCPKQITRSSLESAWEGSTERDGSRKGWHLGSLNQSSNSNLLRYFFHRVYVANTVVSKFSLAWKTHLFESSWPAPGWSKEGPGSCANVWAQSGHACPTLHVAPRVVCFLSC